MGPQAKKNYSRKKNEIRNSLEKYKENIDPFDQLLASPLKQDVSFKPLSYWEKKAEDSKFEKKSKNDFNKLFKYSDSPPDTRWVRKNWNIVGNKKKKQENKKKKIIETWKVTDVKNDEISVLKTNYSNGNYQKWEQLSVPDNISFAVARKQQAHKNLSAGIIFNECFPDKRKIKSCEAELEKDRTKSDVSHVKIDCNSSVVEITNETGRKDEVSEDFCPFKNSFDTTVIESSILNCDRVGNKSLRNKKDNLNVVSNTNIRNTQTYSSDKIFKPKYFEDKSCTVLDCTLRKETSLLNGRNRFKNESFDQDHTKLEVRNEENSSTEKCRIRNSFAIFEDRDACENLTKTLTNTENDFPSIRRIDNSSEFFFPLKNYENVPDRVKVAEKDLSEFNENPDETAFSNISRSSGEPINDTLTPEHFTSVVNNSSASSDDNSESQGSDETVIEGDCAPPNITKLSNLVSNLTISNGSSKPESSAEKEEAANSVNDKMNTAPSIVPGVPQELKSSTPFKNITVRRRLRAASRYSQLKPKKSIKTPLERTTQGSSYESRCGYQNQNDLESDQFSPANVTVECRALKEIGKDSKNNLNVITMNLDKSRLSFCPSGGTIFESTRIDEGDVRLDTTQLRREDDSLFLDYSIALKPGKQWFRSMSVLRQLQNHNTLTSNSKTEKIKGKNYANFVDEVSKLQNCSDSTNMFGRSLLNCSLANATMMNLTVKVMSEGTAIGSNSTFAQALRLTPKDGLKENYTISAKDFILTQCGQDDVLPFEEYFNEKTLQNCKKIGEGVFGEVFKCDPDKVFKIMPIEGEDLVNGEPQKTFEEILSEIVVAAKLSNLRDDSRNQTSCFCEMIKCWCVIGKYPKFLIDLWEEFNQLGEGSENDSPVMFQSSQLFIILEFGNGGSSLESYVFNSAEQSLSIFSQLALSLAAAEKAFEFEHRDLHWGNVLVSRTKEKYVKIVIEGVEHKVATKGVKVCIIDFTLSRISHEGCAIYNDLSQDPGLFLSQGDYQFEIYRMMQKEVENDWCQFKPKTNVYWLHYLIDKMLKMVRYKSTKTVTHKKFKSKLKEIESAVIKYEDSTSFIHDMEFS